jgi:hypothetical protein
VAREGNNIRGQPSRKAVECPFVRRKQNYTRDFLDMLTCGLPVQERRNRLFAMLVAHIDDSGTDGSGPVFLLAGYVADTNQWKRFSDQ